MKKLTKTELKRILKEHKRWVETGYVEGCRADLRHADLRGVDLQCEILTNADLRGADLRGSDLRGAYLQYADLRDAYLHDADFTGADLTGVKHNYPIACPESGSFIGYKKIRVATGGRVPTAFGWLCCELKTYIVKLQIPAKAKRCSATSRKCRCEYAKVLSITNLDGTKADVKSIVNDAYASPCIYTVGEYVYPDSFNENRWNECSHGIHFFITRQEAMDY